MIDSENIAPETNTVDTVKADGKGGKGGKKTIEQIYQKKTQLEHILLRPDTYVGSVEPQTQPTWVWDAEAGEMVQKSITFTPGLYKIFDEIIVNAADNKQRDPSMDTLKVTIDAEAGSISVWNNGSGIPIAEHAEHKCYVPTLIFGNLLTGSNFDDDQAKTTGGRNGYGAKLANIFSTEFIIETADSERKLKFSQTFSGNMGTKGEPIISSYKSGKDYTCVTFKPDFKRFNMTGLDADTVALLSKRALDIAGTTIVPKGTPKLKVFLNGTKLSCDNFQKYIALYKGMEAPVAYETVEDRWQVAIGVSDGSFQQVSFVNSIATSKGGMHVNYIADQVTSRLVTSVKKKNKGSEVKASNIRNHIAVYVNALIVNPAFDSQTKENLTTKISAFGSKCQLSDKLLKAVEKSSVIENILTWAKFKQSADLKKKGGSKRSKLIGITKLDDANNAGTAKSRDCTLILTEGDSAKALAMSGLGVVGRDNYGVFPLKGKLLNVREASHTQIMKNEEIQNLAKIMGLTFGKKYQDTKELRYGHLMIMTDQDHDGSHIKGLLINFLHHFWPSLIELDDFLLQFITPIVKCTKGKKEEIFYTLPQYQEWREAITEKDLKSWRIKYYKGLGTSTAAEAKEYFSDLQTHIVKFKWDGNSASDVIDMAFSKARVQDRKDWLLAMEPGTYVDYSQGDMSYANFINRELILFSHADNERSIPHFMDGLKPSQRNLRQEIKVAQLAGYVSEHSAYHHGEMSLTSSIVGMAQNFVGSNNINLLSPCGQFGTRLMGGKDAASSRYIFTKLEPITRSIFHPDDDAVLTYLQDDGQSIEPEFYVPVIPMVLVNGCDGIGTGWSSSVPNYNPREIISLIRDRIAADAGADASDEAELSPWFRGFGGVIRAKCGRDEGNFSIFGNAEQVDDSTIIINELPVRKWTTDFKHMLESMVIGGGADKDGNSPAVVKDFKENHTDTTVKFTVTLPADKLTEILAEKGGVYKRFKLEGSIATTNMNLFDAGGHIKKFNKVREILDAFYGVRLDFYSKRKAFLLQKLGEEYEKLDNKVRFILAVIEGDVVVSNRKKNDILSDLRAKGFTPFSNSTSTADTGDGESKEATSDSNGYDYLLSMKLWSLTLERVEALTAERDTKHATLEMLKATPPQELWLTDLDALEEALDDFEHALTAEGGAVAPKRGRGGKKAKAMYCDEDSDEDFAMDDDSADEDFGTKKKKPAKKNASKKEVVTTPIELPDVKIVVARTKKDPALKSNAVVDVTNDQGAVDEAEEEMSLMQRLMARATIDSTATSAATSVSTKPKRATKKASMDDFIVDDSDEGAGFGDASADDNDSDVDFGEVPVTKTKPKAAAKPKAAPKPKAAAKPKAAPKPKAAAKPKAKAAPKKKKVLSDSEDDFDDGDDDGDDDDIVDAIEAAPRARSGRARTTTNYAAMLADSDEEEEDFGEDDESDFE